MLNAIEPRCFRRVEPYKHQQKLCRKTSLGVAFAAPPDDAAAADVARQCCFMWRSHDSTPARATFLCMRLQDLARELDPSVVAG